ncbi:MAG: asparagine synthase-related protein, partial [Candidatus Marinimicrobia bacterium]|nr:asparagine synthase-related protein [Candidatus Neomarinimicrobiota bacterium]
TKGLVPDSIRLRKDKIGFGTPENDWFRSAGFQQLVNDILSSDFYRDFPYINRVEAQKAYRLHLTGKKNIARQIWKWINLYIWYQRFILDPLRT